MKIIVSEAIYQKLNVTRPKLLKESIPLSSFQMQDVLCPDIFDEKDKMRPEVRKVLLQIGKDFYKFLGTEWVNLSDIILTGSLANYNWSKFSDVDLHIVLPYSEISKNTDLVGELTWTKKELWNKEHNLEIKDYSIELYAQDTADKLVSGGVYSVLYDKWLIHPKKQHIRFDDKRIMSLVSAIEAKIRALLLRYRNGDCYGLTGDINNIKSQISDLRQQGLLGGGEFSSENIAFKALRRMGLLDQLDTLKDSLYDGSLSIEKSRKEKADDGELKREPKRPIEKDEKEDRSIVAGQGRFMIQGRRFNSLRKAEKTIGIPKSTIEYRLKSDSPEFSDYVELDQ